jgi:hypothetical protein
MANTVELNQQEQNIQGLIGQYLAIRSTDTVDSGHLDEDTLSAFVEGSLSERQGKEAVGHLVRCGYCRGISAELIRLELAFADASPAAIETAETPQKISEVLSGLFSKIFGTADGAVFAHSDDEEKTNDAEETVVEDEK